MKSTFLICLVFFVSTSALADMLFINLNDSSEELKVVQKEAASRGEKLWVMSTREMNKKEFRTKIDKEIASITLQMKKVTNDLSDPTLTEKKMNLDDQIRTLLPNQIEEKKRLEALLAPIDKQLETLNNAYDPLELKRSDLERERNSLTSDLKETFDAIQTSGGSISTLIISGHHSGDNKYWGPIGFGFSEEELFDALKSHSSIIQKMYSFVAWDCHSTELDDVQLWKESFPQLKLMIGFAGSAPKEGKAADITLLEDVLKKETELMVAQDLKTAQKNINSLKNANVTYLAGLVNQCYVGAPITQISPTPFSNDVYIDCKKRKVDLELSFQRFNKYLEAEEAGYEDIPTSGVTENPLVDFYNKIETYPACFTQFDISPLPNKIAIVALIHSKTIQRNFEAYYGVKLGNTRKTMNQTVKTLQDKKTKTDAEIILGAFDCVPVSWITEEPLPGSKPATPDARCLKKYY